MPDITDTEKQNPLNFDKLWDYGNPEQTEKEFRKILPEVEATKDKSAYLQLLTQIARTLGLQMKFEDAHKVLDEVEPQLSADMVLPKIRYYLERGRTFNSSKKFNEAEEMFIKAYELALESNEDFYTVDAAHMLGIVKKGEESLKWNKTAIDIAEKSADPRANGWLGSLYNNTGWTYFDMNEFNKALDIFEKNVVWHTNKGSKNPLIIAKWCVAKTLRVQGKVDDALSRQISLLKEAEDMGINDNGYTFEELGECYLLKGNKEESAKNFRKAYDELSKDIWLAEYEKDRLERMKKLGNM